MMGLWYSLGATGRTEGVRKTYETELVHTPTPRDRTEITSAMSQFLRDQAAFRQTALASQSPDQQSE